MQGVRQLGPMEVFASAPGGSDSIVSETLAPPERLGRKSQLGAQDAQPAIERALATAHTRTRSLMLPTESPVALKLDHRGLAFPAQPEFNQISRSAIAGLRVKLLRFKV